jgi:hypothetical protein
LGQKGLHAYYGVTLFLVAQMNLENTLRNNLIKADNRRFGSVFEHVLEKINGLKKADHISHDRFCDKNQQRIEVKSARVFLRKETADLNISEWAFSDIADKVLVPDKEKFTTHWQIGFGQIKPDCFDMLYYTTVFHDRIHMFRITPERLIEDTRTGYSKSQHRNGTMGQLPMTHTTLSYHLENYHFFTMTYEQLVFILQTENVKLNIA